LDWDALRDGEEEKDDTVDSNPLDGGNCSNSEPSLWKDAEEEEQEGDFSGDLGNDIEKLCRVEKLL
jgi:hypothetical protein